MPRMLGPRGNEYPEPLGMISRLLGNFSITGGGVGRFGRWERRE